MPARLRAFAYFTSWSTRWCLTRTKGSSAFHYGELPNHFVSPLLVERRNRNVLVQAWLLAAPSVETKLRSARVSAIVDLAANDQLRVHDRRPPHTAARLVDRPHVPAVHAGREAFAATAVDPRLRHREFRVLRPRS
jgi:hypothetical protein